MKIFVSYRSVNRAVVNELVTDLEDMGHEVWYDQALEGGQKWWDNILENIRECEGFIFAMTPESLESYPCRLEYTYANALRKNILPVKLAQNINYSLLPVVLQERQVVDYVSRDKEAFKTLSQALRSQPPAQAVPDPLPVPPPAPISPLAPLKAQIDEPTLSYEQQVALVHQLKGYLGNADYASDARALLGRLSQHPTLLASVLRDIQEALSAAPPSPQISKTLNVPGSTPVSKTIASGSATDLPNVNDEEQPPSQPEWLRDGERAVREMLVSLWKGSGWASKRLHITNQRLVFNPGPTALLNRETLEIPYDEIVSLEKTVKNFLNPAILIKLKSGYEYIVMLDFGTSIGYGNREEIISLIQSLRP